MAATATPVKSNPTPIRMIEKDMAAGILATGRPAGFWLYADSEKELTWRGICADGKKADVMAGHFPEVMEWLHVRCFGSVRPEEARNASRDPEWPIHVDTDPGLRIPGAVIREWESPVVVVEPITALTVNAERMSQIRAYGQERTPRERGGRPAGPSGQTVGTMRLHDQITAMVLDGYEDEEIAARVGRALSTVQKAICDLRHEGRFPNDRVPAWRVRRFQTWEERRPPATREQIAEMQRLRSLGMSYSRIAALADISIQVVAKHCRGIRKPEERR